MVNAFSNGLVFCIESLKIKNKVVLLGDPNARVGEDAIKVTMGGME